MKAFMRLKEEKKHSVRYDAQDEESAKILTSLYVMKTYLPIPYPTTLIITLDTTKEYKDANDPSNL